MFVPTQQQHHVMSKAAAVLTDSARCQNLSRSRRLGGGVNRGYYTAPQRMDGDPGAAALNAVGTDGRRRKPVEEQVQLISSVPPHRLTAPSQ